MPSSRPPCRPREACQSNCLPPRLLSAARANAGRGHTCEQRTSFFFFSFFFSVRFSVAGIGFFCRGTFCSHLVAGQWACSRIRDPRGRSALRSLSIGLRAYLARLPPLLPCRPYQQPKRPLKILTKCMGWVRNTWVDGITADARDRLCSTPHCGEYDFLFVQTDCLPLITTWNGLDFHTTRSTSTT